MTVSDQSVAEPAPPATEPFQIASLPPDAITVTTSTLNPRTGEPRRPWLIRLTTVGLWGSTAAAAATLLWSYWVTVGDFFAGSWLAGQFTEILRSYAVLMVVGLTIGALLSMISTVITGYYAWFGYRWTRIAGIISAVLSGLTLLIGPIGFVAVGLAVLSAAALWLPPARSFFDAWDHHRHPQVAFAPPVTAVQYGPLPRYRKA